MASDRIKSCLNIERAKITFLFFLLNFEHSSIQQLNGLPCGMWISLDVYTIYNIDFHYRDILISPPFDS